MPRTWADIRACRDRAEELRKIAEDFAVPSAREGLLDSAGAYDQMAEDLERRLKREGLGRADA